MWAPKAGPGGAPGGDGEVSWDELQAEAGGRQGAAAGEQTLWRKYRSAILAGVRRLRVPNKPLKSAGPRVVDYGGNNSAVLFYEAPEGADSQLQSTGEERREGWRKSWDEGVAY